MPTDLRKNAQPALNESALLKACLVGGLAVIMFWLGALVFDPGASLFWIVAGTVIAAVLSAFLSARRCGLRRRADGVAHGVLAWAMMAALASLTLLPSVNAIDLSGPGSGLYERFQILAAEFVADPEAAAEREQLEHLLRRFGMKGNASLVLEIERAAIAADESGIRTALQKRASLTADQIDAVTAHALILYRDSQIRAADRAILHDNIMVAARVAWSLLLALLIWLLLSMWAALSGAGRLLVRHRSD